MYGLGSGELVSCALLCFNQANWVEQALDSLVSQNYSPLEIVISDDASTDGTSDVVRRFASHYRGKHALVVNVNRTNLGLVRHLNLVNDLCRGRLVVAAAGDDISLPHRVSAIHSSWVSGGRRAQSFYSSCLLVGEGVEEGRVATLRSHDRFDDRRYVALNGGWVHGATEAWTKDLFERFGPLDDGLPAEDVAIPFRAAMLDGVVFIDEPLVRYRAGVGSSHQPWRHVSSGTTDRSAMQRYLSGMCLFELLHARQALGDLKRLGDAELVALGAHRTKRAAAMLDLCSQRPFSPFYLWRAFRSGASLRDVAAMELKRGLPGAISLVRAARRLLR